MTKKNCYKRHFNSKIQLHNIKEKKTNGKIALINELNKTIKYIRKKTVK